MPLSFQITSHADGAPVSASANLVVSGTFLPTTIVAGNVQMRCQTNYKGIVADQNRDNSQQGALWAFRVTLPTTTTNEQFFVVIEAFPNDQPIVLRTVRLVLSAALLAPRPTRKATKSPRRSAPADHQGKP
jgi:hypothetical protein